VVDCPANSCKLMFRGSLVDLFPYCATAGSDGPLLGINCHTIHAGKVDNESSFGRRTTSPGVPATFDCNLESVCNGIPDLEDIKTIRRVSIAIECHHNRLKLTVFETSSAVLGKVIYLALFSASFDHRRRDD
jgi:hypothetical protein